MTEPVAYGDTCRRYTAEQQPITKNTPFTRRTVTGGVKPYETATAGRAVARGTRLRRRWHDLRRRWHRSQNDAADRPLDQAAQNALPPKRSALSADGAATDRGSMHGRCTSKWLPRHFRGQKSPLLRGEWPLQNPRVFTSLGNVVSAPPCLL